MRIDLICGDSFDVLRGIEDSSVDSIVTDPPYGLTFMGKRWDYDVPSEAIWRECLRVLKPGGHLLAFAGTRTQHRMAVRIEDAGFEIRDLIAWVYGSGFPKSLSVSKSIKDNPDEAKKWQGWGTALKPAMEPITVARKPLDGTVAQNVLTHGTGAINVNGCRIDRAADDISGWSQSGSKASENRAMSGANYAREAKPDADGRWPANLIHDGSEEALALLGEAARFFYCAKASKSERGEDNNHPTVKPLALMRYLCRMVTPTGGVVLDPFMGSGSTGIAALQEGFAFIGIDQETSYVEIARQRIEKARA